MSDRRAAAVAAPPVMDLRALGDASSHDLPPVERSVTMARSLRARTSRRRRISGAIGVAAACTLVLTPFPYQRVTAHDVELVVAGPVATPLAKAVITEFQAVLGARDVAVTRLSSVHGEALRFVSRIPARDGVKVEDAARSLVTLLERSGYVARATVIPRRQRVSGSLYAFARDHVIRIRGKGKTALEIEAELRQRLEDEGLGDARVSVSDEPGMRRIRIESPALGGSTPGSIGLGVEGAVGSAEANVVRIEAKRIPTDHAGVIFHADVTWRGRSVAIDVPHSEAMNDAALAQEIESRLKAAGFNGTVTVARGTLQIELHR